MDRPPPLAPPGVDPKQHVVEALAEHIHKTLSLTETFILQRRRVDIAGIEEHIGRLCAATLDLPIEQGRAVVPKLRDLHARIGAIATALAASAAQSQQDT